MTTKRPITPEDLAALKQLTSVRVSPDGSRVAYTLQQMSLDKNSYHSHIWMHTPATGEHRQYTFGEVSDGAPVWSADGRSFAFIGSRNKKSAVYVMAVDGGEPRRITELDAYIREVAWSPDGTQLAVVLAEKDPKEKDAEGNDKGITVRHITDLVYKEDGFGYYPKDRFQVWVFAVDSGKGRRLTLNRRQHSGIVWSADGTCVYCFENIAENPELEPDYEALLAYPVDGDTPRRLGLPPGSWSAPRLSRDGASLSVIGNDTHDEGWGWRDHHVWLVPVDGSAARNLTPGFDRICSNYSMGDLFGGLGTQGAKFSGDGRYVYHQVSDRGNTHLYRTEVATGAMRQVWAETGVVGDFDPHPLREEVYLLHITATSPGDLHQLDLQQLDLSGKRSERLTHINEAAFAEIHVSEPDEVWFDNGNGVEIHGWILKPYGFEAGVKYPAILEIHGGPHTQYANQFMHEFQYLAAQGFVVFYCNPQGSQGYGRAFAKSLKNGWGEVDYPDLMAFTDLVLSRGYVDAQRVGITGGSYGGFMTNWVIGHTTRYAAAVTQRCLSNLVSDLGSDFGYMFPRSFSDKHIWEDPENYWRLSPLRLVKNVKTPTLVIHSEQDLRCIVDQGDQYYAALKVCGVETEYCRFPDESHGLSRSGRPDRRLERLRRIAGWFNRFLKV